MSDLTLRVSPQITLGATEVVTNTKLNLLGTPTVTLEGLVGSATIGHGAVTTDNLQNGAVTADILASNAVTAIKMATDAVTSTALAATAGTAARDSGRKVIVTNGSAADTTVDVKADELVLKDTSGKAYLASGVNLTVNIAAAGTAPVLLGFDADAEHADTWYYVWVISDGTNVSGIITENPDGPNMPTGYTYKAMVAAVQNDHSSNFTRFYARDGAHYTARNSVFTGKHSTGFNSLASVPAGGAALTAFQKFVPPNAKEAWGDMGFAGGTAGSSIQVAATADGVGSQIVNGSSSVLSMGGNYRVGLSQQTLFWSSGGSDIHYIYVSGFQI